MLGMFRQFGAGEILVMGFFGGFLLLTLYPLVDAIRRPENQYPDGKGKTVWIVALIGGWFFMLGWLVGIVYLLTVRRGRPIRTVAPSAVPPPPTA